MQHIRSIVFDERFAQCRSANFVEVVAQGKSAARGRASQASAAEMHVDKFRETVLPVRTADVAGQPSAECQTMRKFGASALG